MEVSLVVVETDYREDDHPIQVVQKGILKRRELIRNINSKVDLLHNHKTKRTLKLQTHYTITISSDTSFLNLYTT